MLSASDIDTYRICPLKYKFARVFRIPQEPTIHQRFGIVVHQVLERFHTEGGGSLEQLMELFEASWRRSGFGDSDDEQQFRERAVDGARALLGERPRVATPSRSGSSAASRSSSARTCCAGASTAWTATRTARYELIDYKTGKAKTEDELREDIQLSLYQMGARESWRLETSAQSYFYVLTGEKVPVEHSEEELDRVKRDGRPRSPAGILEPGLRADARQPRSAASATTGSSARRPRSRRAHSVWQDRRELAVAELVGMDPRVGAEDPLRSLAVRERVLRWNSPCVGNDWWLWPSTRSLPPQL